MGKHYDQLDLDDRIRDRAEVRCPRSATAPGGRQKWCNQRPLAVGQIAWIARAIPSMLNTSGIVPGHSILHLLVKDGESQPTDIAQQLLKSPIGDR